MISRLLTLTPNSPVKDKIFRQYHIETRWWVTVFCFLISFLWTVFCWALSDENFKPANVYILRKGYMTFHLSGWWYGRRRNNAQSGRPTYVRLQSSKKFGIVTGTRKNKLRNDECEKGWRLILFTLLHKKKGYQLNLSSVTTPPLKDLG